MDLKPYWHTVNDMVLLRLAGLCAATGSATAAADDGTGAGPGAGTSGNTRAGRIRRLNLSWLKGAARGLSAPQSECDAAAAPAHVPESSSSTYEPNLNLDMDKPPSVSLPRNEWPDAGTDESGDGEAAARGPEELEPSASLVTRVGLCSLLLATGQRVCALRLAANSAVDDDTLPLITAACPNLTRASQLPEMMLLSTLYNVHTRTLTPIIIALNITNIFQNSDRSLFLHTHRECGSFRRAQQTRTTPTSGALQNKNRH